MKNFAQINLNSGFIESIIPMEYFAKYKGIGHTNFLFTGLPDEINSNSIGDWYYKEGFKPLPSKPSSEHVWNNSTEVWELGVSLEQLKQNYINKINKAAQNKIFSSYPQTKQANLQARWSELVYEDMLLGTDILTNQNSSEGVAIRAAWNWIKDIRARSNITANAITSLSDENTIVADAEFILNNFKLEIENL